MGVSTDVVAVVVSLVLVALVWLGVIPVIQW